MSIYYLLLYFFVYGFFGWCAEVGFAAVVEHRFVNRGFLNGPICPIYGVGVSAVILLLKPVSTNPGVLFIASVVLVTLLEGITGWALDKIFHNKWWDYSNKKFNIKGYVCLSFSLLWGVACVLIVKFIHPLIHQVLALVPFTVGVILLSVLIITLLIDSYVTASAILKFNKCLASMQKIAQELHEISDQIGEEIYETASHAIKKQEASKKILETSHEKLTELKTRYQELKHSHGKVAGRLIKAFPKMQSRNYREQFLEFRRYFEEHFKK